MITPQSPVNNPIYSLQTFLRKISEYYSTIPSVIPDGIYGKSTEDAVLAFQSQFGLPVTGIADRDTWEQIVLVYELILEYDMTPNAVMPFTFFERNQPLVLEGSDALLLMQIMINRLSRVFFNINEVELTSLYDDATTNEINTLKGIMNLERNGYADLPTWNRTVRLYNQHKHKAQI